MQECLCTYFSHLTLLVEVPLEIDSIVPKKEVFSVPQLGHGPFKKFHVSISNQLIQYKLN